MKKQILIIGYVWVEPNSSAAGSRMLQLIELFKKNEYAVTFASPAQKSEKAIDLSELGVNEVSIVLNDSSFDIFIQELSPTVVLFDRFMMEEQFGWRVAEYCPKALRILDTEDLHFLRKVRHQKFKKGEIFEESCLLASTEAKREIASILRCDLSLIISSYEMQLLQNVFKIDKNLVYYLPFLLDKIEDAQVELWNSFEQRSNFVFIGNFLHAPNVDAVIQLKQNLWSLIRKKIPDAELHVYGAYENQQVREFHKPSEGFHFKGYVNNAQKVVEEARVVLAPLRFGAGIKGKLTEAMICGTPSITTNVGAEGMHGNLPWNGGIEENFERMAEKAVELYNNKVTWIKAQQNGVAIINSIYDKEIIGSPFISFIEDLYSRLEKHRQQNFLGNLLQHHTMQATKYMSKWIEEKNK
ncbi:Glycosyltransferase involved in cell wall biosynthesis [Tenacibaculum sp. 190524A02b]|uniref:Glycosyltransferase involved in cell wall biosynthesis n=1 Tax=Tenacibaculum vairaonense TaxID=3137860 RepID=A0ABP1FBX9_9FLAO